MLKMLSVLAMMSSLFVLSLSVNFLPKEPAVGFSRTELESLSNLFDRTQVAGSDVEKLAPLAAKLHAGVKQAALSSDSLMTVDIRLNDREAGIFLAMIDQTDCPQKSVYPLRGIKQKLTALVQHRPEDVPPRVH
ncbi:hypothetical protein GX408_04470 [bacterium]|nr:hypothetical protein [bacterium]